MYISIHILEICIFINHNVYVCITSAWSTFRAAGGTTRWLLVPGLTYAEIHIPGTLKSTANLPLKMNGWKTNYFPFGAIGIFSGVNMLVSGSVKKKIHMEICKFFSSLFVQDPLLYPLRSPNAAMPVMEGFPDIPSSHLFRQDMADGPPSGYEPCQVRILPKTGRHFLERRYFRWWQLKHFFIFTQKTWGNDPIWRAYFSNEWFSHQLVFRWCHRDHEIHI